MLQLWLLTFWPTSAGEAFDSCLIYVNLHFVCVLLWINRGRQGSIKCFLVYCPKWGPCCIAVVVLRYLLPLPDFVFTSD